MIVLKLRANKSWETEAKFNNQMLLLLLVSGDIDFAPPGTFVSPRILVYTQAMVNILAQPSSVRGTHTVNILTTCFNQVLTNLAKCLSPLMTHKIHAAHLSEFCFCTYVGQLPAQPSQLFEV
jgi:hypothetical protein